MAGADLKVSAVIGQDGDQRQLHVGVMAVTARPDDQLSLAMVSPNPPGGGIFFPSSVLSIQLVTTDGTAQPEETMQFASLKLNLQRFTDYDQVQISDGTRIGVADVDKRGANVFPELAGKTLRVINPGEAMTLDFRLDRLTVILGADGRIDSARIV